AELEALTGGVAPHPQRDQEGAGRGPGGAEGRAEPALGPDATVSTESAPPEAPQPLGDTDTETFSMFERGPAYGPAPREPQFVSEGRRTGPGPYRYKSGYV